MPVVLARPARYRSIVTLAAVVLAAGIVTGQSARPAFSVASIKRNNAASGPLNFGPRMMPGDVLNATNMQLFRLIAFAYDILDFQLTGGPDWVRSDRFDIVAKADDGAAPQAYKLMVQSLLADRFKLVLRPEKRRMNAFVLLTERTDGRVGAYLERAPDNCDTPEGQRPPLRGPGKLPPGGSSGRIGFGSCAQMPSMARSLAIMVGAPVVDKTGLTGRWDYSIAFAPSEVSPGVAPSPDLPGFADAVHEQWGLKVERQSTEVDVLVIESIQPPTEN